MGARRGTARESRTRTIAVWRLVLELRLAVQSKRQGHERQPPFINERAVAGK